MSSATVSEFPSPSHARTTAQQEILQRPHMVRLMELVRIEIAEQHGYNQNPVCVPYGRPLTGEEVRVLESQLSGWDVYYYARRWFRRCPYLWLTVHREYDFGEC